VQSNRLTGSFMQYGFVATGLRDWRVEGNVDEAAHWGAPTETCNGIPVAAPGGFLRDDATTDGTFQSQFVGGNAAGALSAVGLGQHPPGVETPVTAQPTLVR